jgi:hypothetical protein
LLCFWAGSLGANDKTCGMNDGKDGGLKTIATRDARAGEGSTKNVVKPES